jgi:SAM-dependent methyltransferase
VEDYGPATYGDRIAEVYDQWYTEEFGFDPAPAVALLAALAGTGRALELGIGTGRVAIPLAARGVEVVGIDSSEAMAAKMRSKPGGDRIEVVMGNFADVDVEGGFSLVYVPFTTLFALPSQDEQIRCLTNVESHLDDGGHFVMDAFVPDHRRYDNGSAARTVSVGVDHVMLDASLHDPVDQRVTSSHVILTSSGVRLYPVSIRYCWPAELDVMARLAGLVLVERLGGYDRRPFDATSTRHVSIYRRAHRRVEEGTRR